VTPLIHFISLDTDRAIITELLESPADIPAAIQRHLNLDSGFGALLHFGFKRPGNLALSEFLVKHTGYVMVTEAFRLGVIAPDMNLQLTPIGLCEATDKTPEMPVLAICGGWGIELSPDQMPDSLSPTRPDAISNLEEIDNTGLVPRLAETDVANHLAILEIAPPEILNRPIESFQFSVRIHNVCASNGIAIVADLKAYSPSELMNLQNFGAKCIDDLCETLVTELNRHTAITPTSKETTHPVVTHQIETNLLLAALAYRNQWLEKLTESEPRLFEVLESVAMENDFEFLSRYSELDPADQTALHQLRFDTLTSSLSRKDPIALAHLLPPKVQQTEFRLLNLNVRANGSLMANGITRISDLACLDYPGLTSSGNMGTGTMENLCEAMLAEFQRFVAGLSVVDPRGSIETNLLLAALAYRNQWLERLHESEPQLFEVLKSAEIQNDFEFLSRYSELDPADQAALHQLRFDILTSSLSRKDPIALAHLLPPKVQQTEFRLLKLNVRASGAMAVNGITRIIDLVCFDYPGLTSSGNMGVATMENLCEGILMEFQRFIAGLSVVGHRGSVETFQTSLIDAVSIALPKMAERDRRLMRARLAIGEPRKTLEELQNSEGITGERVRQLVRDRMRRIDIDGRLLSVELQCRLESLLQHEAEPVYLDELGEQDRWFAGFDQLEDVITPTLPQDSDIKVSQVNGRPMASRLSIPWADVVKECKEAILQKVGEITRNEVAAIIQDIVAKHNAPELASACFEALEETLQFTTDDDPEAVLTGIGSSIVDLAMSILTGSDQPVAAAEIRRQVEEKRNRPISHMFTEQIKAAGAGLFGRSLYGLPKHITLNAERRPSVVDAALGILQTEPSRQWTAGELLELLEEEGVLAADETTSYMVTYLLQLHSDASDLGRHMWQAKGLQEMGTADRIDLMEAAEHILRESGRPLPVGELLHEIKKTRGIGTGVIVPKEPVIQVAPGVWGLSDRDIPISVEQQQEILEVLFDLLKSREVALHIDELQGQASLIDESLGVMTPYLLFRVADRDERFWLGRGSLLGLASWESLGRLTVPQAFKEALVAMPSEFTNEDLRNRITELLQRPVTSQSIATRLNQAEEVEYDRVERVYRRIG